VNSGGARTGSVWVGLSWVGFGFCLISERFGELRHALLVCVRACVCVCLVLISLEWEWENWMEWGCLGSFYLLGWVCEIRERERDISTCRRRPCLWWVSGCGVVFCSGMGTEQLSTQREEWRESERIARAQNFNGSSASINGIFLLSHLSLQVISNFTGGVFFFFLLLLLYFYRHIRPHPARFNLEMLQCLVFISLRF
jgi:hypothetical protein